MTAELLVVVPTRSRPHNVLPVAQAWLDTGAFAYAELTFAIDYDDPAHEAYIDALQAAARLVEGRGQIGCNSAPQHQQLVPKLNRVVKLHADLSPYFAIGFAGDDHLPRTPGWAPLMLDVLHDMGTGIVYPDDGYQGENIPTSWVMTADIIRDLGVMVPAPVEHLFCDNAVRDLGNAAGCLRYLPEVLIEHLHPVAGKAENDDQYKRVNSRQQWRGDKRAYREWRDRDLAGQAARVRALMMGE